jgi:tripartite-type tricarboxylate transporter receptor subunit TctC
LAIHIAKAACFAARSLPSPDNIPRTARRNHEDPAARGRCRLLACCAFAASAAGNYPTKPITLVVGYTAGGSVDLVARTVAPELGKRLGQSVVIENLGGAGGTIGAQKVVKADADGYTLLMGSGSEVSIARLTNPAVRYDGEKDLAPITFVGTQPMVLVGKLQLPAKDAGELMALAKAQPGKLSYASSGVGTPLNLAGELIKQQGKVNITHVPYKGPRRCPPTCSAVRSTWP